MRILLVDDEIDVCEALKSLLEEQGHRVTFATTAQAALAEAPGADLAICDLNLGGESGLHLIAHLRALRPDLKVLVLTAEPSIDRLQRASDLGVSGFLTKPEGFPELLASIDRLCGLEIEPVALYPSGLKTRLAEAMPFFGEVAVLDGRNWAALRSQIRTAAPACVLVDGTAPEAAQFLDACRRELEGRAVFVIFREEDFATARAMLRRRPGLKCLATGTAAAHLLRAIRQEVMARRERSEQARTRLAQELERCPHAAPLHTGYYCTLAGACPHGEDKNFPVTVRGKDHYRCPRRPLFIPDPDRAALLAWRGVPDDRTVAEYRAQALDEVHRGKTHLIVNGQGLEGAALSLAAVLGEVEAELGDRTEARIDVVNLSPHVLQVFQDMGLLLARTQFYPRVLMEVGPRAR